jgi:hypothetical protein
MGVGIGYDKYDDKYLLPVYFDIHTYFSNSILAPFFSFDIGRSYGNKMNKGGTMINPSLGIKAYVISQTAMDVSIGYKLQEFENEYSGYNYSSSLELITFKMGVVF